jgi:hypothetical protein
MWQLRCYSRFAMPMVSPAECPPKDHGPRSSDWTYRDSVFWQEIDDKGSDQLKLAIKSIVVESKALAASIATGLPTFTRHDEVRRRNYSCADPKTEALGKNFRSVDGRRLAMGWLFRAMDHQHR